MEEMRKRIEQLESRIDRLEKNSPDDKLSIIVFSGSLDKLIAAFIIATGAAAMGSEVTLFFTFWGTAALRDPGRNVGGKDLISKMFGFMLPKGRNKLKLSKMHMAGMGTSMLKHLMRKKNAPSLDQLFEMAGELGVQIKVCEMSMDLMGFKREEIIDYPHLDYCGVATFLADAKESQIQMFI